MVAGIFTKPPSIARSGRLTYAQQEWLRWFPPDTTHAYESNVTEIVSVGHVPVAAAVDAVHDLVVRHEGLRSIIQRDADPASERQHVCDARDLPPGLVTVAEDPGDDRPIDAFEAAKSTGFRLGMQWPIAVVLLTASGLVTRVGIVVDHSAVDAWGIRVLREDLLRAMRARTARERPFGGETVEQPLDAASAEVSAAGLTYQRRAQDLWRRQLTRLRQGLGDHRPRHVLTGAAPVDEHDRRYHSGWYASRRAAQAADILAGRLRISASSAYLAAFGSAIAHIEGSACAGVFPFSANRLSAAAKLSVRKAMMPTMPVVVPRAYAGIADAVFADCDAQQLRGRLFGNVDPHATDGFAADILGHLDKTGVAYARFNYINDALIGAEANARALSADALPYGNPDHQGRVRRNPPNLDGSAYYAVVQHGSAGAHISLAWHEDTGWGEHIEAMMWHIEDSLVWAASGGTGKPPRFGERA